MLLAFLLTNVLRATTACTISTSQLPKVLRTWGAFTFLTWKCASRHNGAHFSSLIWPAGSALAALARLLFDPPEPQIIAKTQCIATSLPFRAPASCLFWFSPSLIFSLLDFSSLTLPTSAFPSLHIVGSLTSKLPSTSTTAQGGGGSFRIGNLEERLVVVNHGWQSESTDWPKGGWSCDCWSGCNGCSGHLTHNCWM